MRISCTASPLRYSRDVIRRRNIAEGCTVCGLADVRRRLRLPYASHAPPMRLHATIARYACYSMSLEAQNRFAMHHISLCDVFIHTNRKDRAVVQVIQHIVCWYQTYPASTCLSRNLETMIAQLREDVIQAYAAIGRP